MIPCIKAMGETKANKQKTEGKCKRLRELSEPWPQTLPPNAGWKTHFKGEVSNADLKNGLQFREAYNTL